VSTQTYATQPTQYYLNAIAAQEAGGPMINLAGGTLVVGDGNGVVPSLSSLIAANGVTHEVWRGQVITSVAVDPNVASQLDVTAEIPAAVGGVEIGPFTITELAILDASGNCCIVATTNVQKTTSGQGQITDLIISVGVGFGVGSVTLLPPSGNYATMSQVVSAYNSNLPKAASPLTQADVNNANGWINRTFGLQPASQPADPPTSANEPPALGYGRAATATEFSNGAPTAGRFPWPWPTLQQVSAAIAAVKTWVTALLGSYLPLAGGTMTGALTLAADPISALQAATKEYVDGKATPTGTINGNGYVIFPNGLIIQWGSGSLLTSTGPSAAQAVTFPIAFPHAAFAAIGNAGGPSNSPNGDLPAFGTTNLSATGFTAFVDNLSGGQYAMYPVNLNVPYTWMAIGY